MRAVLLGHAKFSRNIVLVGFQVDVLVFQVHCTSLYHDSSDIGIGICLDGDGFMSIEEGLAMTSPTFLPSPLLPSSSGTTTLSYEVFTFWHDAHTS